MMQQTAYSVVLFLLLGVLHIEGLMQEGEIRRIAKKCGANDADTDVAVKYQVPNTPSGKCLMLCMMKEVKTLTADGDFVEDHALQSLISYWPDIPKDKLGKIAKSCASQMASSTSAKNSCEYGFESINCVNKGFVEEKLLPLPPA